MPPETTTPEPPAATAPAGPVEASADPDAATADEAGAEAGDRAGESLTGARAFELTLENFTGPFDLLLSLIAKRRLDITEVALAEVTDEFIAHITAQEEWDLDETSEFLLIAATLLDLKAARLLPRGDVESEEDLELLEARDLLFARLLQYRAFKEVAEHLGERWAEAGRSYPRSVPLEPHLAALLPELVMRVGVAELARLAAAAFAPRPGEPQVDISHVHNAVVPVREQAAILVDRLRRKRVATFRALTEDAAGPAVVVSRFLALLELYREGAVAFDQAEALAELTIRWTGDEEGDVAVVDDYDEPLSGDEPFSSNESEGTDEPDGSDEPDGTDEPDGGDEPDGSDSTDDLAVDDPAVDDPDEEEPR